jgi:hypothetical protein
VKATAAMPIQHWLAFSQQFFTPVLSASSDDIPDPTGPTVANTRERSCTLSPSAAAPEQDHPEAVPQVRLISANGVSLHLQVFIDAYIQYL